jgi:hypothetical protein
MVQWMLLQQTLNLCSNFHPPLQIFAHIFGFNVISGDSK